MKIYKQNNGYIEFFTLSPDPAFKFIDFTFMKIVKPIPILFFHLGSPPPAYFPWYSRLLQVLCVSPISMPAPSGSFDGTIGAILIPAGRFLYSNIWIFYWFYNTGEQKTSHKLLNYPLPAGNLVKTATA